MDSKIANIGIFIQIIFQSVMFYLVYSYLKYNEHQELDIFLLVSVALTLVMTVVFFIVRFTRNKRAKLEERLRQIQFMEQLYCRSMILDDNLKSEAEKLRTGLQLELLKATELVSELECDPDNRKIEELLELSGGSWNWGYCANTIVNVILSEKAKECADRQIEFQVKARIPTQISLSDYHICSLLSNLLDNAIEACCSMEEAKRKININATVQKQCFYLLIENSCTLEYAKRPRRQGRGLGVEIVKKIVEHYQGQMQVKTLEEWYSVEIIFPIKGQ